jgi:hypothetical protein
VTDISIKYKHVPEHHITDADLIITIHRKPSQKKEAKELVSIFEEAWKEYHRRGMEGHEFWKNNQGLNTRQSKTEEECNE